MKKGFYFLVASLMFAFVSLTNVKAANYTVGQADFDNVKAAGAGETLNGIEYDVANISGNNVDMYFLDGDYTLSSNIALGNGVIIISEGKTASLNTAGYSIETTYYDYPMIEVTGTFSINGGGTLSSGYGQAIMGYSGSTTTVGTITSYGVIANQSNSTLTITGATITKPEMGAAYLGTVGGTLIINSATVNSGWNDSIYVYGGSVVTINGGTFTTTGEDTAGLLSEEKASSITINGGTFSGGSAGVVLNADTISLTGGTFIYTGTDMYGAIGVVSDDNSIFDSIITNNKVYSNEFEVETKNSIVYTNVAELSVTAEEPDEEEDKEETKSETKTEEKTEEKTETKTTTTYKYLEGAGQTYTINEDETASFRIDADYSLFENGGKVYVDDALVDSKNYTSKSGSTIITFTKDFMSNLKVGDHKLKVVFNNEGMATTSFTIKAQETASANTTEEKIETTKKSTKNPKTGDSIIMYITLLGLSIIGIISVGIYNKKLFN